MKTQLATLMATVCYVGRAPKAPGSFGSLAAFPFIALMFALYHYAWVPFTAAMEWPFVPMMITFWAGMIVIGFLKGWWASVVYMREQGTDHDPKEIVIDEVVGQMIVFLYAFGHIFREQMTGVGPIVLLGLWSFVLFRLFDIVKPWPISWCDKHIKGGFGVMFDDVAAALLAIVVMIGTEPWVTGAFDALAG